MTKRFIPFVAVLALVAACGEYSVLTLSAATAVRNADDTVTVDAVVTCGGNTNCPHDEGCVSATWTEAQGSDAAPAVAVADICMNSSLDLDDSETWKLSTTAPVPSGALTIIVEIDGDSSSEITISSP